MFSTIVTGIALAAGLFLLVVLTIMGVAALTVARYCIAAVGRQLFPSRQQQDAHARHLRRTRIAVPAHQMRHSAPALPVSPPERAELRAENLWNAVVLA